MAAVVIGLLWVAAIYRIWISARRERTLWRTSFTVATVCVAGAYSVHHSQEDIDLLIGIPNVAGLVSRVITLVGIGFLLIYHEHLRRDTVSSRVMIAHLTVAVMVVVIECVAWVAAPVHGSELHDLMALGSSTAVVVYCVAFWIYLGIVFALVSRTCLMGGRTFRRADPARSVSLLLIGLGELCAIPVVVLWTASLILLQAGHPSGHLADLGDALLPWPLLLNALGVLSLLLVPYLLALVRRWREWRLLRPLWVELVQRYPDVHLEVRMSGGPLARLQVRVERAVIETRDALRVAPVETAADRGLPVVEAVARSLWAPCEGAPVYAADILNRPETREADMQQLLALAGAYGRVGHARS